MLDDEGLASATLGGNESDQLHDRSITRQIDYATDRLRDRSITRQIDYATD